MSDPVASPSDSRCHLWSRINRCYQYFKRPYLGWFLSVVGILLVAITEPLVPAMLKPLLDQGFIGEGLAVWMVPVALVGVFGLRGAGSFIAQYALARIANLGVAQLRQQLFQKLQTAEASLYQKENASTIINTFVHEVNYGSNTMVNTLLTLGRDSLTLIALLSYLLYLNWQLIMVIVILFPMIYWVMRKTSARMTSLNRQSIKEADNLAYTLEENVMAYREIRLQSAQQEQSQRFYDQSQRFMRLTMKSKIAAAMVTPLTQLLTAAGLSAVISVALLQSSLNGTTVGSFAAFVTGMLMLVAPIKHLSEITSPLNRSLISLERAFDFLTQHPDETGGTHKPARVLGKIEFEQVHARYPGREHDVLQGVSLTIPAGQICAFVGVSGSGKTTLVNLLPRWIQNSGGRIKIDDTDIREYDLQALRQQIAMVSQHLVIMNDTIFHNVCMGQIKDRDRALDCLKAANLGDWLNQLPKGLDTTVGHNASELSGGQRQRLAIARAMYKDSPILILDEATSALDNESERMIQDALRTLCQGRTTLVIAHRLSTVEKADSIVVMSSGKILEKGNHATLLAQQGIYWGLVNNGVNHEQNIKNV